jgi:hypothetical protein
MVPATGPVLPTAKEPSAEHGSPVNGFVAVTPVDVVPGVLGIAGEIGISGGWDNMSGALGLRIGAGGWGKT